MTIFCQIKKFLQKKDKLLFWTLLLLYRNRNAAKRLKVETPDNSGFTKDDADF